MALSINGFPTLKNDGQGVFFQIPHGIPDPSQECPLGPDQRRRVRREGSQSLCVYVAFSVIRRHIGPTFCEQLKHLQRFETAFANMQKAQVEHEATLKACNQVLCNHPKESLLKCGKERAAFRVKKMEDFSTSEQYRAQIMAQAAQSGEPLDLAGTLADTPGQIALHRTFIEQDTFSNLYDFCLDYKMAPRIKIQLAFLAAIGKNSEQIKAEIRSHGGPELDPYLKSAKSLTSLPVQKTGPALQNAIQMLAVQHFEMDHSLWCPKEPFPVLLSLMQNHGPLGVTGSLGIESYQVAPRRLEEKWGDREVYAWAPGSPKKDMEILQHAVTLIGAIKGPETAGGGFVYFLDPINVSDPANPTLDKIYKISYKNLQANAEPLSYRFAEGAKVGQATGFAWKRKPN